VQLTVYKRIRISLFSAEIAKCIMSCPSLMYLGIGRRAKSHLDKRLDFVPLRYGLLPHSFGHFSRVSLDAGDDGMGVRSLLGAFIKLLDDDHLFPSLSPLENNSDL
jgi:hypothetical protein